MEKENNIEKLCLVLMSLVVQVQTAVVEIFKWVKKSYKSLACAALYCKQLKGGAPQ